jgi:hypothetical protein
MPLLCPLRQRQATFPERKRPLCPFLLRGSSRPSLLPALPCFPPVNYPIAASLPIFPGHSQLSANRSHLQCLLSNEHVDAEQENHATKDYQSSSLQKIRQAASSAGK